VLPSVPLDVSHLTARNGHAGHAVYGDVRGVDLTGKQKLVLLCGDNRNGKTFLARWLSEQALLRDDGNPPVLLALDDKRDLCKFVGENAVAFPPPGTASGPWFEQVLNALEKTGRSAIGDFGGGDHILLDLAREVPRLHSALAGRGITPVVLYFLSGRVSDLTLATALEGLGFKPEACALVLNCAQVSNPARDFEQIRHQPEYRALLERGAIELWMPKHFAAAAVEGRRLGFAAADGRLGGFDDGRNAAWLLAMQEAMAPISSWLP
jgi:hypothetical protein